MSKDVTHTPVHKEAFCLMWYACKCGHRERIWNSRDGVTPFGCDCPSCKGGIMDHVEWRSDVATPDHKLANGQRFWRDGTPDEAEAIIRRRIEQSKGSRWEATPDMVDELIAAARNEDEGEFHKGWPMLDINSHASLKARIAELEGALEEEHQKNIDWAKGNLVNIRERHKLEDELRSALASPPSVRLVEREALASNLEGYAHDCIHIGSIESIKDLQDAAAIVRSTAEQPVATVEREALKLNKIADEMIGDADNLSPTNDTYPANVIRKWAKQLRRLARALAHQPRSEGGKDEPVSSTDSNTVQCSCGEECMDLGAQGGCRYLIPQTERVSE